MTYGVLTEDPAGLSMDRGDSLTDFVWWSRDNVNEPVRSTEDLPIELYRLSFYSVTFTILAALVECAGETLCTPEYVLPTSA